MGNDPREKPSTLRPAPRPTPTASPRPQRLPYKVVVALFRNQWVQLRDHCENREVSGSELVSQIISDWLLAHPSPPKPPAPNPPDDDQDDVEVSQQGY